MIKNVLISMVVLVVVVFAGTYFYLDSILKSGIETVGPRVLGTGVTVSSVLVSPLNGSGRISGLIVRNPEPFNAENIFELTDIQVNLDVNSLLSDVIIVESIIIEQPIITYETRITSDNVRALIENLPSGGRSTAPEQNTQEGSGKQIVIRDLQLNGAQVNLVAANMQAPVLLTDIRLQNIGEEGNAATFAEATRQVLVAVRQALLNANLPTFEQLEGAARERIEEGVQQVEEAVSDTVEEVGDRLRTIFN